MPALFLEKRMINYYSCRNFHCPMNHKYMTAAARSAIRQPSINTTIHISGVCYTFRYGYNIDYLGQWILIQFCFWNSWAEYRSRGKASSSVMCLVLYPMFVADISIMQWVLSSITNWTCLCSGQAATARCLLPLPATWMSFFQQYLD